MKPAFKVRFSTVLSPAKTAVDKSSPVTFWNVAPAEKRFFIPKFTPASKPRVFTSRKESSAPFKPPAIFKFIFLSSPNVQLLIAPKPLCKMRAYFGLSSLAAK